MDARRFRGFMDDEILTVVKEMGCVGFHMIQKKFQNTLKDPPDPSRTRGVLFDLYMKEKLDRVMVPSNFEHSPAPFRGHQYVYFLPGTEPEWIREFVKKQDTRKDDFSAPRPQRSMILR